MQTLYNYVGLIDKFLNQEISTMDFLKIYFDNLKAEWNDLDKEAYEILIFLFYELNDYTDDPDLLREKPTHYIDESRLRESALKTLQELQALNDG